MLASSLANKIIQEFNEILANPFHKVPSYRKPLSCTLSLNISRRETSIKILKLLKDQEIPSPFKCWLEFFSSRKDDDSYFWNRDEDDLKDKPLILFKPSADSKLFRIFMSLIQSHLLESLDQNLSSSLSRSEYKFKVEWESDFNQSVSSSCGFRDDDRINIKVWNEIIHEEDQNSSCIKSGISFPKAYFGKE